MKDTQRLLIGILLFGLIGVLFVLFWPRQYAPAERVQKQEVAYWDLPTGSRIAYTHLPATAELEQPYPIVYLHGGPGGAITARVMAELATLTQEGFALYFYDQLGSGRSNRLADISGYTVQRHVADLHAIVEQLQAEKVILIGQSWGAILASAFVAQHPERVHRIVFTSPGPLYPLNPAALELPAPDSLQLRAPVYTNRQANTDMRNLRMQLVSWLARHLGVKLAADHEVDAFADALDQKTYKSALCDTSIQLPNRGGSGYYAGIMTYNSLQQLPDFRAELKGLNMPVLVMKGSCDNQPWGATAEYLQLFQNHQFVWVPNAGHFIGVEQPEMYVEAIRQFLLR